MISREEFNDLFKAMVAYASDPDRPDYVVAPSPQNQQKGVKPLDTLPAQWWNWFLQEATIRFNGDRNLVGNMVAEIESLLSMFDIQADKESVTQLKDMFENEYPEKILGEVKPLLDELKQEVDENITPKIESVSEKVEGIEEKIPEQASAENQLADKEYVQRIVSTDTANFRGNWPTWAGVPEDGSAYPADYTGNTQPTVNDYLVVQEPNGFSTDWKKFTPNKDIEGGHIFPKLAYRDGLYSELFYMSDTEAYRYNEEADTWEETDWTHRPETSGENCWYNPADGKVYCDVGSFHFVYDNGDWSEHTWDGEFSPPEGSNVWVGADNTVYYSRGSAQYKLDGNEWVVQNWENWNPTTGLAVWVTDSFNYGIDTTNKIIYFEMSNNWMNCCEEFPTGFSQMAGMQWFRPDMSNHTVFFTSVFGTWRFSSHKIEKITYDGTAPIFGGAIWYKSNKSVMYSYNGTHLELVTNKTSLDGPWRFRYTGNWAEKGKSGWEPEYSLGTATDITELSKHFAKGNETSLDIGTVTAQDGVVHADEDIIVGTGDDRVSLKDFRTLVIDAQNNALKII